MSRITKPIDTGGGGEPFFNSILPLVVPIIFLGIGFVFGLKTSAMGAGSVIGFAKTKGKMVVRKAPGVAYRVAYKGAKLAVRGTAQIAGKIRERALGEERQKRWREWGEKQQTIAATKSRFGVSRYARRVAATFSGGRLAETQQAKIKKIEELKDIKDMERAPELLEAYNNAMTDTRRIAILNKATEKGKIGDLMDEKKYGKGALKEKEMDRILGKARAWDSDSTIKKAVPHLAAKYVTDDELKEAKDKDPKIDTKEKLIMSEMKPVDYKNISAKTLKERKIVDAILTTAMGSHISQLFEQHGRAAASALEKEMQYRAAETNFEKPEEWLKSVNPRLHKYLAQGGGRGLVEIPKRRVFAPPPETLAEKPIKGGKNIKKTGPSETGAGI